MIIYNLTWLNNLDIHNRAEHAYDNGLITAEELQGIKGKYIVGFNTSGVFVRIGLFLLTIVIVSFSASLLSLIMSSSHLIEHAGWPIFLGLVVYALLELFVKSKNYYHSGVDDALLWISASFLFGGIVWMLGDGLHMHFLIIALIFAVISAYFTLRFADTLMAAAATVFVLASVFFAAYNMGPFAVAILPFIMMVASAIVYAGAELSTGNKTKYYADCLTAIKLVGLLGFYVCGNYYVVSALSELITDASVTGRQIPLGWLFWMFTVITPFAYIAWGIMKKNVLLLRTGLVLIAGAVLTFRNYYHVLPVELALTFAGAAVLLIVYGIVRYLKIPKNGFTYQPDKGNKMLDYVKLESIIIADTFAHDPQAPVHTNNPFGGGDAGGGGSSGSF